jgi:hypothetical protein
MRDITKSTVAVLAAAATLLMGGCAGDQASRRAEQPTTTTDREGSGAYMAPSTDMDEGRAARPEDRPSSQRGAKTTGDDREPIDGSKRGLCLSGVPGDPYGGAGMPDDEMGGTRGIDCPDWVEPKGTGPGTGPIR